MFGLKKKKSAVDAVSPAAKAPSAAPEVSAAPAPVREDVAPENDDVGQAERLDAAGRHEEAVDALRRGWVSGSVEATRRLGERFLIGRDAEARPQEGASLIALAAEKGDAEASRILANLAGAGSVLPQSWATAFDHLADAAVQGSELARAQLRLLTGQAGRDWRTMRGQIDVAPWLAPPPRVALCETPRIRVAKGLCPPAFCDWLIGAAKGKLKPALMYDNATKRAALADSRRCSEHQFDIIDSDLVLLLVRARIAALAKLPAYAMEPPQIFHYRVGEEIKAHYDFVKGGDEGFGRSSAFNSERIVSSITYLNDDYEGGELDFIKAKVRHRGAKGDVIYFANVDLDGRPDPRSLHAGLPVTSGEKWVLSQWIHNQPFNAVV